MKKIILFLLFLFGVALVYSKKNPGQSNFKTNALNDNIISSHLPPGTDTDGDGILDDFDIDDDNDGIPDAVEAHTYYSCANNTVLMGANQGKLYGINVFAGTETYLTTSPFFNGYLNCVAANANDTLVYYANQTTFYYWDPVNDEHHVLADLSGQIEGVLHGGSASFFFGQLFFISEGGANGAALYRAILSDDGRSFVGTHELLFNTGGDFGDIAVMNEGAAGVIYGSATAGNQFWKYDIATEVFEIINDGDTSYQLAVDTEGNLWYGSYLTKEIGEFDKTTGEPVVGGFTFNTSVGPTDLSRPLYCATLDLSKDSDGDGIPDHEDLDSDNDGIPDIVEAGGVDADHDGRVDNFIDANGDGMDDNIAQNLLQDPDTDADGIPDRFDLDSDNDGIFDLVEAGGVDTDNDGIPDGFTDANFNGWHDGTQTTPLPLTDTDGNGIFDYKQLDSDDDGCFDTVEAGFTDENNDGYLGGDPVTTDVHGVVISDVDGYTLPLDGDANSTFDYQEAGTAAAITSHPQDAGIFIGEDAVFSVEATGSNLVFQWQQSSDSGTTWSDVNDSGAFSGATTSTLTVSPSSTSMDGYQFRVLITGLGYICSNAVSNPAILTLYQNVAAVNDDYVTDEDTPITENAVANDFDPDGDGLIMNTTPVSNPSNGSVTLNADGTFTYTPNLNYTGTDSFVYEVCDNGNSGLCDNATVTITINPVNDAPVAVDDEFTTPINTDLDGTVRPNDNDPDGDDLTVNTTPVSNPSNGSVVLNADGTFIYTPNLDYFGTDTFDYEICDDGTPSLCDVATVTITIYPTLDTDNDGIADIIDIDDDNDGILDVDETFCVNPDSNYDFESIAGANSADLVNASTNEIDGATMTLTHVLHGTAAFTLDQISDIHFTGMFGVTLGHSSTANSPENYFQSIFEFSHPLENFGCRINDLDDGDVVSINGYYEGNLISISSNYYLFDDEFVTYTGDNTFSTVAGSSSSNNSTNGAIIVNFPSTIDRLEIIYYDTNGNGTITYTEFTTTCTYDDFDNDGIPNTLDLDSDNDGIFDLVEAGGTDADNNGFVDNFTDANNDGWDDATAGNPLPLYDTDSNGTTDPYQLDSDDDGCFDSVEAGFSDDNDDGVLGGAPVTFNGWGMVTSSADGYTTPADEDDNGTYDFQQAGSSPSVSTQPVDVTITEGENTSFSVIASGNALLYQWQFSSDGGTSWDDVADGGVYSGSQGATLNITGALANMNGYLFRVVIFDPSFACGLTISDPATLTVNPASGNNPPVAEDDSCTTNQDTPYSGNVLDNDSDPDGDNISVSGVITEPTNGTISLNADGSCTYTPNAGFSGTDSFVYEICDDGSPVLCDQATATITVNPAAENNPPVAEDDSCTTDQDTPYSGNVLDNDSDPDGDNISVSGVITEPTNGTIALNADGSCTYTPNPGFSGTDSFVYEICDDGDPVLCDQATATITVNPVAENNPPVAEDDSCTTDQDTPYSGNVLDNDSDPDGDNISVSGVITEPTNGTIALNADGSCTYTPNPGFTGTDSFVYEICDDGDPVLCDQATATIIVDPVVVNNPPVAEDDNCATGQNAPFIGNVLDNDSDPDGDNISVSGVITEPTNGTIALNADGSCTYTPNPGFTGTDSFVYEICDDGTPALCDQATATITVNPVVEEFFIPNGFSPNGTDKNETFYIKGIDGYPKNTIWIFNRWGDKVYEASPYKNEWDGTNNYGVSIGGEDLPSGTYYYILDLGDGSDAKKGYIYLYR